MNARRLARSTRPAAALALSIVLIGSAAFVRPTARPADVPVTIKLVDAATGAALPGVVRVRRTGDGWRNEPGTRMRMIAANVKICSARTS